jgi:hypothetical protein
VGALPVKKCQFLVPPTGGTRGGGLCGALLLGCAAKEIFAVVWRHGLMLHPEKSNAALARRRRAGAPEGSANERPLTASKSSSPGHGEDRSGCRTRDIAVAVLQGGIAAPINSTVANERQLRAPVA